MDSTVNDTDIVLDTNIDLEMQKPLPVLQYSQAAAKPDTMSLVTRAIDQGANVEVLEKLLSLHERWEATQARKAFDRAMSDFRSIVPEIEQDQHVHFESKDKSKPDTDYWHASLGNICNTINPILAQCGLSYNWITDQPTGLMTVTCIVSHEMGHREKTSMTSGLDTSGNKNALQSLGSTNKYLRRYTLESLLGLSTTDHESDDDGAASSQPEQGVFCDPEQVNVIRNKLQQYGFDEGDFCSRAGIESLDRLTSKRFNAAINSIERKAQEASQ